MAQLVVQPDINDSNLLGDSPDTADNANALMQAIMTGGSLARRGILNFDISALPAGITITSAILELVIDSGSTTDTQGAYAVTRSWTQSTVTWNKYNGVNTWTTAGGDFTATNGATVTPGAVTGGTVVDFNVTAIVSSWYSGSLTNNGLLIKLVTESGATKGVSFRGTRTAAASSTKPKLTITYTLGGGGSFLTNFV